MMNQAKPTSSSLLAVKKDSDPSLSNSLDFDSYDDIEDEVTKSLLS